MGNEQRKSSLRKLRFLSIPLFQRQMREREGEGGREGRREGEREGEKEKEGRKGKERERKKREK